jgi:hypothetical protein
MVVPFLWLSPAVCRSKTGKREWTTFTTLLLYLVLLPYSLAIYSPQKVEKSSVWVLPNYLVTQHINILSIGLTL